MQLSGDQTKTITQEYFKVSPVRYEVNKNTNFVSFVFRIDGPEGAQFHIKERYSTIRKLSKVLRSKCKIDELSKLTKMPSRKPFYYYRDSQIQNRMEKIWRHLSMLFNHPSVRNHEMLMLFFQTSAMDNSSLDVAIRLAESIKHNIMVPTCEAGCKTKQVSLTNKSSFLTAFTDSPTKQLEEQEEQKQKYAYTIDHFPL